MKKLTVSLAVLGAMLLGGCASQKPGYDYTAFRQARPRSILVVMPTNDSPDIKGATSVLARATVPLAEKGYYVFPVAVVDEMFRQNGLTGGHDIQSAPIRKVREIFGADAILYLHVEEYGTSYQILSSDTRVSVSGKLVDLKTGKALWEGRAKHVDNGSNGGGGLIASLVSAVANQIIGSATDRGYQVAATADAQLFYYGDRGGVLMGPYHPDYQKDYQTDR